MLMCLSTKQVDSFPSLRSGALAAAAVKSKFPPLVSRPRATARALYSASYLARSEQQPSKLSQVSSAVSSVVVVAYK